MPHDRGAEVPPREGERIIGSIAAARECESVGHDPTIGLRYDVARMALVADCRHCGDVVMFT